MLRELRGWAARVASKAKAALRVGPSGLLRGIFPVSGSDAPARGTVDILEGYDSMPWLRAVADKVGFAVACVDWQLLSVRRGGKAIRERVLQRALTAERTKALLAIEKQPQIELRQEIDHPFWDALDNPNPYMGRVGLLKLAEIHVDLVGDAYWVKERNALGVCCGFWPVPPHWVLSNPTPAKPTFRIAYRSWQVDLPAQEVAWFHEPSPANPYTQGSGVGWVLGDELEVDEYAAKMAKQLFFNQARPDFVVYGLDDDVEKRRLERDWLNRLQGFWRAHKPYFMTGEPKFHEFQRPTMEQLVYPGLRKAQRDIVLQTWGAAPELFGIVENSNRATIEGGEYLTSKFVTLPRAERMRGVLQHIAEEEYDDRLVVHFMSPVAEDKQFVLAVARAAPHSRRVDEWRALQCLPPIGGPEGQAMLVPLNSRLTDDLLAQLDGKSLTARGG